MFFSGLLNYSNIILALLHREDGARRAPSYFELNNIVVDLTIYIRATRVLFKTLMSINYPLIIINTRYARFFINVSLIFN